MFQGPTTYFPNIASSKLWFTWLWYNIACKIFMFFNMSIGIVKFAMIWKLTPFLTRIWFLPSLPFQGPFFYIIMLFFFNKTTHSKHFHFMFCNVIHTKPHLHLPLPHSTHLIYSDYSNFNSILYQNTRAWAHYSWFCVWFYMKPFPCYSNLIWWGYLAFLLLVPHHAFCSLLKEWFLEWQAWFHLLVACLTTLSISISTLVLHFWGFVYFFTLLVVSITLATKHYVLL